jgi:gamma-glutamyltranspeptidase / glutathione hydrolase
MRTRGRTPSVLTGVLLAIGGATMLTAGGPQKPGAIAPTKQAVASRQKPAAPGTAFNTPPADEGKRVEAARGMVTSANSLASEAGAEILGAGGNAVDGAVATAFAIGVVEPQMSGLGGSGTAVVWMKRDRKPANLDFYAAQPADSWKGHTTRAAVPPSAVAREASPGAAQPAQQATGQETGEQTGAAPRPPGDLTVVGIPGNVAGLLALHDKYGTLPRGRVMAPAIRLAEEGFPVGQILAGFIGGGAAKLKPFPKATALYFPDGQPIGLGAVLRNPELADALRQVAREGRRAFYEGPLADELISTLNAGNHPATLADLAAYEPHWKRPLCTEYHGRTILSAAPPENGLQVLHTLELLEPFNLKTLGLPTRSAAAFDVLVSALRVGGADSRGNSDPNWMPVPANGIVSAGYAAERKALVGTKTAQKTIAAGNAVAFDQSAPSGACAAYDPYGPAPQVPASPSRSWTPESADPVGERAADPGGETTHISVVDKDGNAVALTQTNSSVFGSGGFVHGFFLNDSGFRFTDENINAPSTSRWRIRTTTIAPTIVLQNGQVQMVVGAPGGGRIPTEITQVMMYVLDYGMDPLDAVKMPRVFASPQDTRVQLEHGFAPQLLREVREMGYQPVPPSPEYARLYIIVRRGNKWIGVADTRHDGQPRGVN